MVRFLSFSKRAGASTLRAKFLASRKTDSKQSFCLTSISFDNSKKTSLISLRPKDTCARSFRTSKKAQMEIQQMAFMIIAVFIFFALVGMFFLRIQVGGIKSSAAQLQKEQAISSLQVIADMPELNFDSTETMTIDEDKLRVMSGEFGQYYDLFWPVASVEVYKIYPAFDEVIKCPAPNCNYYDLYNNNQSDTRMFSGFVSICSKQKEFNSVYDRCEVGKLVVGVKIYE